MQALTTQCTLPEDPCWNAFSLQVYPKERRENALQAQGSVSEEPVGLTVLGQGSLLKAKGRREKQMVHPSMPWGWALLIHWVWFFLPYHLQEGSSVIQEKTSALIPGTVPLRVTLELQMGSLDVAPRNSLNNQFIIWTLKISSYANWKYTPNSFSHLQLCPGKLSDVAHWRFCDKI